MEYYPVIIVGAGASGLAASIAAAQTGARVCLLETASKAGRSILASGNGRCNFANSDLAPERYNDPAFVAATMGDDPLAPILNLFTALGLWYVSDGEGRLFPRSRAASSVLDVLLEGAGELGVDIRLNARVSAIEPIDDGWRVRLEDGTAVACRSLIWAAGGASAGVPVAGAGLDWVPERVALCPLACNPRPPKALDGVRIACSVALLDAGGSMVAERCGEVLFRSYGLSGIAIFDLSRLASPGDHLVLDLLPESGADELECLLERRIASLGARCATSAGRLAFLDGAVHPKVARHIMMCACGEDGSHPIDVGSLARMLKGWEFCVRGYADESHAQVTQGGLSNAGFDARTLESRRAPGLFACGEVLDVDGECGGLNLAWAWSSGMVAGVAAARRSLELVSN